MTLNGNTMHTKHKLIIQKIDMTNKLLNKKQLSEYMGVSMGKVELMMSDGLKYIKMNRNVRFRMEDINDYLNKRVVV